VVDLVDELTADPLTAGMTVGVMVLRPGVHSQLVAGLLLERLGPTLFDERQVLVGGPDRFAARGRDILVVSCVVDADDGTAGFASVTGRAVTLAACRATRQLWVVHSVPAEALGRGDARRSLIEHCRTPVADPVLAADRIRSPFQRALRRALTEAGYTRVLADYRVGGHVVDLVVEGPVARLGVVCDGDRWDGPEEWDRQRHGQAVLERCGWTFERVRASAFARDPDRAVAGVVDRLVALGVPTGDWTGAPCLVPTQRQWPRDFHPSGGDRADGNGPLPDEAETAPADPITLTDPADPTGRADPPGRADLTEADVRDRPAAPAEDLLIFEIRDWARRNDLPVGDRGRLSPAVIEAWNRVHPHRLIER
jgi:very-short-patch-repair endonuclease